MVRHADEDTLSKNSHFPLNQARTNFQEFLLQALKFRMKIFLIFILYMIPGPVGCYDVIGYTGGSVIIFCNHQQYGVSERYFCKMNQGQCETQINIQLPNTQAHKQRFSMFDSPGTLTVIFRQLSLQAAGTYNCGEIGVWHQFITLKVNTDPCCTGPKTITCTLGDTITITCTCPEVFETNNKHLFKKDSLSAVEIISTAGTKTQKGRFSIFDDSSVKVVSVKISDVRESDGGVYYCGVSHGDKPVTYYSFFTEIQLHVTDNQPVSSSTEGPVGTALHGSPGSSVIIIVCIFVFLLLTGVSVVILYKLRWNKTQGSDTPNIKTETHGTTDVDYENDPPGNQNIRMGPVYQSLDPNTNQSDSVYQTLNPDSYHSNSA